MLNTGATLVHEKCVQLCLITARTIPAYTPHCAVTLLSSMVLLLQLVGRSTTAASDVITSAATSLIAADVTAKVRTSTICVYNHMSLTHWRSLYCTVMQAALQDHSFCWCIRSLTAYTHHIVTSWC
jgi:hypothetical protein